MDQKLVLISGVLIGLVLGLFFPVIASSLTTNVSEKESYVNTLHRFSFQPPVFSKKMILDNTEGELAQYFFNSSNGYFSLTVATQQGSVLSSALVEKLKVDYKRLLPDFVLLSEKNRVISVKPAYELIFSRSSSNGAITQKQIIVEKDNRLFSLTFTTPSNYFQAFNPSFEESISTFQFTGA